MTTREELMNLLVGRSLKLGNFTLASGAQSTYYIDARRTTMCAQGQYLVGKVGLEIIEESGWNPTHVGGLTLGADPISYAIAHESWSVGRPLDAFTVRKAPKVHGTGQRVEGGLPPEGRVVVIEDSMTSGGSALNAVEALVEHGVEIAGVFTLVDREEGGRERVEAAGYPLASAFTAAELLQVAEAGGS